MRAALCLLLLLAACKFEHGAAAGGGGGDDIDAAVVADGLPDVPAGSWWDPAWSVRFPITITNGSAGTIGTGYQVGVTQAFNNACPGSRNEIRVVYRDEMELTRVFDGVGPPAFIWFPLAAPLPAGATSAGDYWFYCVNPNAGLAPEDPNTLFDFFDNFNGGSIDTTVWIVNHTVSQANGKLVCGTGAQGDNGVVTKTAMVTAKHAVDFVAIASSTTGNSWWAGFQLGTADVQPWLHWWTNIGTSIAPDFQATSSSTLWNGTQHVLDTNPHFYSVENYGMKSMYRLDDVMYETHDYDVAPPAMLSVRLWNGNANPSVSYDMVRVRQAVDPPPTVVIGGAQMKM